MSKMKRISVLLLACTLCWIGCEEDRIEPVMYGVIRGTVVDDSTGLVLANATVTTSPSTDVVNTDANGAFQFSKVPVGTVTVRVELTGYSTGVESVTVYDEDTTQLAVRLLKPVATNELPSAPTYISPANGSTLLHPDSVRLLWNQASDPNANDQLKYQVLLFPSGASPDTLVSDLTDTTYLITGLKYATTYFWQIVASDPSGTPVFGQVWQFTTESLPDQPVLFARKKDGNYDIWSAATNGTNQIQLTNLNANQWRPRRNPQRTRIAFLSDELLQTNLYTMANNGTDIQLVSMFPVSGTLDPDLDYTWSPDGTRLLFMQGNKLYAALATGSIPVVFATAPSGFTFAEADWSAATNQVIARVTGPFGYQNQIMLYNSTGTLISTEVLDLDGAEGGPAFSLTGDRFLYSRDLSGLNSPDGRQLDTHIFIRVVNNGSAFDASLTKLPGTNDIDPRYSANGARIIFVNTDNTGLAPKNIFTMTLGGTDRMMIVSDGEMPDWK